MRCLYPIRTTWAGTDKMMFYVPASERRHTTFEKRLDFDAIDVSEKLFMSTMEERIVLLQSMTMCESDKHK